MVERSTIATPHSAQRGTLESTLPPRIAAAQLGQQKICSPWTT
jgi:hypothetical protein